MSLSVSFKVSLTSMGFSWITVGFPCKCLKEFPASTVSLSTSSDNFLRGKSSIPSRFKSSPSSCVGFIVTSSLGLLSSLSSVSFVGKAFSCGHLTLSVVSSWLTKTSLSSECASLTKARSCSHLTLSVVSS